MVKRTTKRKQSYRKRGARRGKIYGAAAGQLWKDVKMLKSIVNVEYKVQDTNSGVLPLSTTPGTVLFNGLLRGDDYNQRNGRSVKWVSIYQRMTVTSNPTATTPRYVRYILYWVKDPDAIATSASATAMFGTSTPNINAMMNLNLRKDFNILYDKVFKITPLTGGTSQAFAKIYKKTNVHTIFNAGNTGLIGDIESGALYCMVWSDTATASEQPTIYVQSRLRYVDN